MPKFRWFTKEMSSHLLLLVVGFLILVSAIFISTFSTDGDISKAFTLATTHQPERYTQLYFTSPAKLPSYAATGQTQTVPFSVVNDNAQPVSYSYQVITTIGNVTTRTSSSFRLASGRTIYLTTQFTIPTPLTKAHLVIKLLNTDEQLTLASTS